MRRAPSVASQNASYRKALNEGERTKAHVLLWSSRLCDARCKLLHHAWVLACVFRRAGFWVLRGAVVGAVCMCMTIKLFKSRGSGAGCCGAERGSGAERSSGGCMQGYMAPPHHLLPPHCHPSVPLAPDTHLAAGSARPRRRCCCGTNGPAHRASDPSRHFRRPLVCRDDGPCRCHCHSCCVPGSHSLSLIHI